MTGPGPVGRFCRIYGRSCLQVKAGIDDEARDEELKTDAEGA